MAPHAEPPSALSSSSPEVLSEELSPRAGVRAASTMGHPPSEFGSKGRPVLVRELYAVERDLLNVYVALVTLAKHMANFESVLACALATWSTLFYTLYEPESDSDGFLSSRLDFTIIGTAIVFPTSFLINETFRRREMALQRLAHVKTLLCQIQAGMLLWRWKNTAPNIPSKAWKGRVKHTLHEIMRSTVALLKLPKWSANRHTFTKQGRAFRRDVVNRQRELTHSVLSNIVQLHVFVEDLKDLGLTASEATRVNQYTYLLQMEFESLVMIKTYRTTNIARSFVRITMLVCPAFYGPYFAYVARSSGGSAGEAAWTIFSLVYAVLLSLVTTFVLQGLVKVQRALEDPFVSPFVGEAIALAEEEEETYLRLDAVELCARAE